MLAADSNPSLRFQLVAPFVNIHFLGSSLTFMMVYVWGRRNEHVRMSFLGLFPFTAPYLPWVLFSFSILLGNSATTDLIGIIVGHMYYFLEGTNLHMSDCAEWVTLTNDVSALMSIDVYPRIASIRGWKTQRPLATPRILCVRVLDIRPSYHGLVTDEKLFVLTASTCSTRARRLSTM